MRNHTLLRSLMLAVVLTTAVAGCSAVSGRQTAGEYVDDTTITTKVKTQIIQDLGMKEIGVETMQNVVQLSGFVDTQQTRTKAGEIARGVTGVKEVKNNIVVR